MMEIVEDVKVVKINSKCTVEKTQYGYDIKYSTGRQLCGFLDDAIGSENFILSISETDYQMLKESINEIEKTKTEAKKGW